MNTPFFALPIFLFYFLPPGIGIVATAIAWRFIAHRALFLILGTLAIFGVQQIVTNGINYAYFQPGERAVASAKEAFVDGLIFGPVLEIVVAIPLLWWLAKTLKRA